jgi:PAS domain S-box-containing protein
VLRERHGEGRAAGAARGGERDVLDAALDCVVVMDESGRIVRFNPAAERTFGYPAGEVVGRRVGEVLVPPSLRARHARGLERYLRTGEAVVLGRRVELDGVRRDGTVFPLELTVVETLEDGGRLFTAFLRDLSAQVHARRLIEAQYEITRALAESVSVDEATPRIMRVVCETVGWDLGALWVADDEHDWLRFVACWARDDADRHTFAGDSSSTRFGPGEGLIGAAWSRQSAGWHRSLETEQGLVRHDLFRQLGICSAFNVPIRAPERAIGVMEFLAKATRDEDPELLDMAESVGWQIGAFIQRRAAEDGRRALERQRDELLGEMQRSEAAQRAQIAQALHDDTVQVMAATLLTLDRWICRLHGADRVAALRVRETLAVALERTRSLMFELRPPLLEAEGLAAAISALADQAAADGGFHAVLDVDVGRYPEPTEALVYETIREAVTNARKHAHARELRISVRERSGVIHGRVVDDGRGFDLDAAADPHQMRLHIGLSSLRERTRLAGGDCTIETHPNHGTEIAFHIPT